MLGLNIKSAIIGELKHEFPHAHDQLAGIEKHLETIEGFAAKLDQPKVLAILTALNHSAGGIYTAVELSEASVAIAELPVAIKALEAVVTEAEKEV